MSPLPPGTTTSATVERMCVLDGGEATVEDISQWSPTGLDDELIGTPAGKVFAHDVRGIVRRTVAAQLAELAVAPEDVTVIAFSHAHFDHVGNSRLFPQARWYVQEREYEAMFGPNYGDYGFLPELYATMQSNETVTLQGDHDVFGDGIGSHRFYPGPHPRPPVTAGATAGGRRCHPQRRRRPLL